MPYTYAGQFGPEAVIATVGGSTVTVPNATVTVYETDGVTKSTLYTGRSRTTAASNPTATDSAGNLTFYTTPGQHVVTVVGAGITKTVTLTVDPDPGDLKGVTLATISSKPAQSADDSNRNVVFTGSDFTQAFTAGFLKVAGTSLGSPVSGYSYVKETSARYLIFESTSGHNESLSVNDGRTGAVADRLELYNGGQGDIVGRYTGIQVYGAGQVGATNWLANPAGVVQNGDLGATVPHVYLNVSEFNVVDNGNDIAASGHVLNFTRTVATAGLGEVWLGYRVQGSAAMTQPIDCVFSVGSSLRTKVGVDLSLATYDTNKAALTLAQDQRIYLKATSTAIGGINWYANVPGTEWIGYGSGVGGVAVGSASATALVVTNPASAVNYVQLSGSTAGNEPSVQVQGTDVNINLKLQPKGTGTLDINPAPTTTSAPSAGAAGALPATPAGYVTLNINNVARKVAYY